MTRERGPLRLRRRDRRALLTTALVALSLTASGCVVVHGEREVLPTATRSEAARALADFTAAYNAADKGFDRSKDAGRVTGALAAIDGARLTAGHANHPSGNPNHTPLILTDAKFTIPKKAGRPRFFLADARGNKGGDVRWLLVFTRDGSGANWRVAYLTLLAPSAVPEFAQDAQGWAEPVEGRAGGVAVSPADLGADYADYLQDGGDRFADGPHTSGWRTDRERLSKRPGLVRQYQDEPLTRGDYAPLALRTADGGALVFFATHHFEKQTAAAGTSVPVTNQDVRALTKGEVKQSLTMEFVSNEAALDPPGSGPVKVIGRVQGLTGAVGE
ncbi:hypothetical protein KUM39_04880 [Streptomyces sp. J2-1]|uniref:hypothetical protein n=1 Tax=Streptomyces corallincola TaxID=2851888 RepID=UPI001C386CA5|nr:hypothetical protein [Streptomyces corallincola]MBV2353702.1 hypothetical protein [Streptomyces corallincola]